MQKPLRGECREYFHRYIDLVPDNDFVTTLQNNTIEVTSFFAQLPANKQHYRYAEDKWTPKEILLHIMDTERIFTYRALAAIRGDDKSALPGYDENSYAANADANSRSMDDLLKEFNAIRTASQKLFEHVTDEQSTQTALVADVPTTTRALAYVIIGHTLHHMQVIRERYL